MRSSPRVCTFSAFHYHQKARAHVVNPRRACAARVSLPVCLCVCVSTLILALQATRFNNERARHTKRLRGLITNAPGILKAQHINWWYRACAVRRGLHVVNYLTYLMTSNHSFLYRGNARKMEWWMLKHLLVVILFHN